MRRLPLLAALLLVSACLDGIGGDGDNDAGPREGYPAAPYGLAEGEIIEDLAFVDGEGQPFTLRDIYADGGNSLLLISTAAPWCAACVEEQPDLQSLHQTHGPRGLFVMVSVFEDASYNPAEAADAERWQTQYSLDFQVVADPDFVLDAYYDSTLTPMNMLVEVDAMRILRISTGWDPVLIESLIEAKL